MTKTVKKSKTHVISSKDFINCENYIITTGLLSAKQICNTGSTDQKRREEIHDHMEEKQPGFYVNIFILTKENNKS